MKQFDNLLKHVQDLKEDFEKFYIKNNKTAGTRIRKGMQDLKEMAQKIRIEVQEKKNQAISKPTAKTMKK
jgi:hypothetical protein